VEYRQDHQQDDERHHHYSPATPLCLLVVHSRIVISLGATATAVRALVT